MHPPAVWKRLLTYLFRVVHGDEHSKVGAADKIEQIRVKNGTSLLEELQGTEELSRCRGKKVVITKAFIGS